MRQWKYSSVVDIKRMQEMNNEMREFLEQFDSGHSSEELLCYCRSLVQGQRNSLGRTIAGSWSVAPNDEGMDSDARVEFIFQPTYLAVAILSRTLLDYPWVAVSIEGFRPALVAGLEFSATRNLRGSGYDALEGLFDAWSILCAGRVPTLVAADPTLSEKLFLVIRDTASFLSESLAQGSTSGMWGEDFSKLFEAAIETYYLSKDRELVSLVRSSDSGDFHAEGPTWIGS